MQGMYGWHPRCSEAVGLSDGHEFAQGESAQLSPFVDYNDRAIPLRYYDGIRGGLEELLELLLHAGWFRKGKSTHIVHLSHKHFFIFR